MKVLVIGALGMLGSMVLDVLRQEKDLELLCSVRKGSPVPHLAGIKCLELDAEEATVDKLVKLFDGVDWVINCAGVIKYYIHDGQPSEVERAIRVNALFPHLLARAATVTGCRILQIATDCVYSGDKGAYLETAPHDPLDVYGKTKSLGEVVGANFMNIRCSIVGPERKGRHSLLEWFLNQPKGSKVMGYLNHFWNGVTTLHFAKVCLGVIRGNVVVPQLAHLIPADVLSKGALLQAFGTTYGRQDIAIEMCAVPLALDRSLATVDPEYNSKLWRAAGYPEPPSLALMIDELAEFCRIMGD